MKPRCQLCGRTTVALAIDFDGGSRGVRECQECFDRQFAVSPPPASVHPRPFNPETDLGEPVVLWWVSFASATGFLGVVIVPGTSARLPPDASFEGALLRPSENFARLLGCHPGGDSAVGYPLDDEQERNIDDADIARLLSREEAEALLAKLRGGSTR